MMASASCTSDGVDGEAPSVLAVSLAHLLQGPDAAPPAYLRLSLTRARKARRRRWRRKQPAGEMTLRHIYAPRDYLKLSVAPPDEDEPTTVAGGSPVASVAKGGAEETTLPRHKKRKLAARVQQEAASTAASLAIVIHGHAGITSSGANGFTTNDAASTPEPASGSATAAPFSVEPIDAVPLRVALPLAAGAAPMEPAWIRPALGLQPGHALHFIAQKRVEQSDVDAQQSRLRIPSASVGSLLPLLSDDGRHAANLLDNPKPRERPKPLASGNGKAQGRKHGGLVVPLYINRAGDRMDARLTRWDSNDYTVLKYGNCQSFVRGSGLKVMDRIQIWAFQNPGLHLVIHKVDGGETTAAPSASSAVEQAP
ncbi:hypothetical protein D1007_16944 [Hordeum vulgare]|nr:hypothetical protein D1007_16944 [Hordeum vulgare]